MLLAQACTPAEASRLRVPYPSHRTGCRALQDATDTEGSEASVDASSSMHNLRRVSYDKMPATIFLH